MKMSSVPEKYVPSNNPDGYLSENDLADAIADAVGIDNFSSDQYETNSRASYTRKQRQKIYEYITGEEGGEYTRVELNYLIMDVLGSELHAQWDYEFIKEDLQIIYEYVKSNLSAERSEIS